MASHRRPRRPGRAHTSVLTAAAATAVALSAQGGGTAHAVPGPVGKEQVKAQVDQLLLEQEAATEKYNGATERADQLRQQAGQLQDRIARGQERVAELASGLAAVAGDEYRHGGIDPAVQLMFSADPDAYLSQASSAGQVASTQAGVLKALRAEQGRLDQQKAEAAAVLGELDRSTQLLSSTKAEIRRKLQESERLLGTLNAADRAAIVRGTDAPVTVGRPAGGGAASRSAARGGVQIDPAALPQASGNAATAVRVALEQQGKPYEWAAGGPGSFDCSGLMVYAYAKAGVALPRTSQAQGNVGTGIGTDWRNAQPGDLVVYRADRTHVGMYIGNGMVVHAPRKGDVVKIMKADAITINTIRRI
ncbi:NlpC/P60 family protein [Kitasatospora sp. NPDC096147]|uniref:C40 family peptidase n=1 Tax=Kitasatospora sp. NPDC096147 TaxID=3364093 RepID=UPI00382A111A